MPGAVPTAPGAPGPRHALQSWLAGNSSASPRARAAVGQRLKADDVHRIAQNDCFRLAGTGAVNGDRYNRSRDEQHFWMANVIRRTIRHTEPKRHEWPLP